MAERALLKLDRRNRIYNVPNFLGGKKRIPVLVNRLLLLEVLLRLLVRVVRIVVVLMLLLVHRAELRLRLLQLLPVDGNVKTLVHTLLHVARLIEADVYRAAETHSFKHLLDCVRDVHSLLLLRVRVVLLR